MMERTKLYEINSIYRMSENSKFNYTYLTGKLSATLVIPIDIVKKHGLDNPSNVVIEETENGILLRKSN
ncbi:MAG: AbrB/MazE/SpoVT family DNA-binding domain-containing protein [Thaumarchaeota archaeon]|nr:MAG: AbrB/MazE/SpoVT family DNA-binding domain-containing protein [Nitrososphaerota archaeon]